jgi:hypothetical protein
MLVMGMCTGLVRVIGMGALCEVEEIEEQVERGDDDDDDEDRARTVCE